MRRLLTIAMAAFFLSASLNWAQTRVQTPQAQQKQRRHHTRPPYSGPWKAKGKIKKAPSLSTPAATAQTTP